MFSGDEVVCCELPRRKGLLSKQACSRDGKGNMAARCNAFLVRARPEAARSQDFVCQVCAKCRTHIEI